ncbi:hypothetical protein M5689_023301 [Euphorbia peplus]|nr:hypothetical protein M5689_023301 [Euphorbia peplus]
MASSKIVARLSSRLQSFTIKLNKKSLSPQLSSSPSISTPHFRPSRLPVELSCLGSMMPLHSALASARLVSSLSTDSQSWALVPQGVSMPL